MPIKGKKEPITACYGPRGHCADTIGPENGLRPLGSFQDPQHSRGRSKTSFGAVDLLFDTLIWE